MDIIRAEHVTKKYPGVTALNDVSISFESGKVHALVGKNGSGKSTLIKIFSGSTPATEGSFYLNDQKLHFDCTMDAFNCGIATVYQELSLVPGMSVAENIFLGRFPVKRSGLVDKKRMEEEAAAILSKLGIAIDPTEPVKNLSAAQKQLVEIAKGMSFNPKVIQFDEPTSSLSTAEIEQLLKLIRQLKEKDVIILYVSHRMNEIWEIADTCTVFRDSNLIGTVPIPETPKEKVLSMMFGDVKIATRQGDYTQSNETVLEVINLCSKHKFNNISFKLHKGEILGIAGLMGAGRTELLRAIFGADPYDSGDVILFGEKMKKITPEIMRDKGLAMIQEDRHRDGLSLEHTIQFNLCLCSFDKLKKHHFFADKKQEEELANKQVENLQIKIASTSNLVSSLSGGNQQKVVVGRWMSIKPKIMFFDEPSRGIDVNAKQQIFNIMWQESESGVSSVMVSSELEELLEVCTRILIMKDGEFIGEVRPSGLSVEQLYSKCMGE